MDYEQKYKNLVERLMKAKEDYDIADERYCCVIDGLVPELEDERIRREIIADIQKYHPCWQLYKDYTSWINWLEKQGNKAFSVERVFAEAGIKPAYKDGTSWCVLIGKNIQEGICGFGETQKDAYVNFLKELWGKAFEQKTSEWSEDDNEKIEFLCNLIKRNISEGNYSFGDGAKNGFVSKQEAIKMLQSLKSRVQPQPKSEWSDEDEGIVSRIMTDLENCESEWGSNKEEEKDWLKSLKGRVQPHPAWKPTKQQMKAIKQAAEQNRASEMGNILDNLFVELKNM